MSARARGAGVALACGLSMSACSVIDTLNEGSRIDYKSAGKLPTLEVPPDLVGPRVDERFNIPDRGGPARTLSTYQAARPAEAQASSATRAVLPSADGVRVERLGSQRFISVSAPPDRVYPLVREFWQESGFLIQTESPSAGIMETDWAENRAKIPQDFIRSTLGRVVDGLYSTGERDKFRTRLEVGPNGGTEIYVSHRGMIEVYSTSSRDSTVWTPRPADRELEAEFIARLMAKLGVDQQRARTQVAAVSTGMGTTGAAAPAPAAGPERARIVGSGDAQALEVLEGFDRSWRRVGLALDRGGFTVEDRDRSQGLYYVRYIDPEVDGRSAEKPGFLGRLFSSLSEKRPTSAQQYRIKLVGRDTATVVTVLLRDGQPLQAQTDRQTGTKILGLLREQLQQ